MCRIDFTNVPCSNVTKMIHGFTTCATYSPGDEIPGAMYYPSGLATSHTGHYLYVADTWQEAEGNRGDGGEGGGRR